MFFEASNSVKRRLGEICSFVWADAVAMWRLRQDVQEFIDKSENKSPTDAELYNRFVKPSGVTSADLRTTCLKWSWEKQQGHFAKILLFDLCALYEGWLENVVRRAMPPRSKKKTLRSIREDLQFPTSMRKRKGVKLAIRKVNKSPSSVLKQDVFPVLKNNKKNAWSKIDKMIIAYRYFKGCRNAFIHNGGIARTDEEGDYRALLKLAPSDIGLHGPLKLPKVMAGQPLRLALPDVVALSSIIRAIIVTLDAELAVSKGSEADMLDRLEKAIQGQRRRGHPIPGPGSPDRDKAILSAIQTAGLPQIPRVSGIETLLKDRGVV